ncbi:glycosyltransferase family 2 protein [Portibacter marinus]|uniref:glycosyltransferase family 2 protein n=1 Tax=Portibacter marinus TaxID=2898660 RepID=UPI001F393494|nr:glycosyltransferase [Portibacter marinus]
MKYDYSILIPTWKNHELLIHCIQSIIKHSAAQFQILVYVNEAEDKTIQYLKERKIEYLSNQQNVGICTAMNALRELVDSSLICYLNDDMYVLPGWDTAILEVADGLEEPFLLSSTMIEPSHHGSSASIYADFGSQLHEFQEEKLLRTYNSIPYQDWSGSAWPPLWLPTDLWDRIGGFSQEFSPGMYSDPDLAMKAWDAGVRYFRGVESSRVYHFGSKSTARLSEKRNDGRMTFLKKWGMTARYFYEYYLKMGKPFTGPLSEPKHPLFGKLVNRWKLFNSKNT